MAGRLRRALAGLYGAGWEARRAAYARGWRTPERLAARIVSLGNLTVGGAGKTTFALHLAGRARALGVPAAIVCRRYRPGPAGVGDEELLLRDRSGLPVHAGTNKREQARAAVAAGARWVFVDDGFSHWALARDRDLVLLDASDPWGGGALLPAGRLREPRRALQRAQAVILTRVEPGTDLDAALAEVQGYAPAARIAAARHAFVGVTGGDGRRRTAAGPAHVVTATGNPEAVRRSALAAGFEDVTLAAYRDHHWFRHDEVARERRAAAARDATLLLTAKDAVRWPRAADPDMAVLDVAWEWVQGGAPIESWIFGEEDA